MRQAWLDEASACPAPAACSGKMSAGPRQVSICEPLDKKSLVHGDVVVTMELGGTISTVGRVVEKTTVSAGYRVEFPDGFTLDRSNDEIVGRVCR